MDDYKKGVLVLMQHGLQEKQKLGFPASGLCSTFGEVMVKEGAKSQFTFIFQEMFKEDLFKAFGGSLPSTLYWWLKEDYKSRLTFLQTLVDND